MFAITFFLDNLYQINEFPSIPGFRLFLKMRHVKDLLDSVMRKTASL